MSRRKLDEQEKVVPAAEASGEGQEAFLRRWSRRKHEAQTREIEVAPPQDAEVSEPPAPSEKVLTDADMPPLESLDEKSDFSVFLSSGVSETLRRQALRKLFLLPSINQRCPLDSEYHDCHGFEPLGNVITHEMREEIERAAQKLKEAAVSALVDDGKQAGTTGDLKADMNREPQMHTDKHG
jgi:hypothetical protein